MDFAVMVHGSWLMDHGSWKDHKQPQMRRLLLAEKSMHLWPIIFNLWLKIYPDNQENTNLADRASWLKFS